MSSFYFQIVLHCIFGTLHTATHVEHIVPHKTKVSVTQYQDFVIHVSVTQYQDFVIHVSVTQYQDLC